jgi:hypothetical protein
MTAMVSARSPFQILDISQGLSTLLGYSPQQASLRSISLLSGPDTDQRALSRAIAQAAADCQRQPTKVPALSVYDRNGSCHTVRIVCTPCPDAATGAFSACRLTLERATLALPMAHSKRSGGWPTGRIKSSQSRLPCLLFRRLLEIALPVQCWGENGTIISHPLPRVVRCHAEGRSSQSETRAGSGAPRPWPVGAASARWRRCHCLPPSADAAGPSPPGQYSTARRSSPIGGDGMTAVHECEWGPIRR